MNAWVLILALWGGSRPVQFVTIDVASKQMCERMAADAKAQFGDSLNSHFCLERKP